MIAKKVAVAYLSIIVVAFAVKVIEVNGLLVLLGALGLAAMVIGVLVAFVVIMEE